MLIYLLFVINFTYFVCFIYSRYGSNFFIKFLFITYFLIIVYFLVLFACNIYIKSVNLVLLIFFSAMIYFAFVILVLEFDN